MMRPLEQRCTNVNPKPLFGPVIAVLWDMSTGAETTLEDFYVSFITKLSASQKET